MADKLIQVPYAGDGADIQAAAQLILLNVPS